ncbi:hypothetical protein C1H46_030567 [Malus baccata]|uniref:Uncharacterized protein n=1 Tax=Malus baccata TaxID=106549 RepID=A0A540LBN2_MALBA|nr:hypothetical protein C1H46_030567 [Malus baccata]
MGKIPQAQQPSCQLHPSDTGRLNWGRSPVIVTPQLPEGNVPRFLSSSGARHEMTDDDTPETLRETSNPNKVVKVRSPSPNQKRSVTSTIPIQVEVKLSNRLEK